LIEVYEKSQMFGPLQISMGVIMDVPSFAEELKVMKKFGEDLVEAQQLSKPIDFCDLVTAIADKIMKSCKLEEVTYDNFWAKNLPLDALKTNYDQVWEAVNFILEEKPAFKKFLEKQKGQEEKEGGLSPKHCENCIRTLGCSIRSTMDWSLSFAGLAELMKPVIMAVKNLEIVRASFRMNNTSFPQRDHNNVLRNANRFKELSWWKTFVFPVQAAVFRIVKNRVTMEQFMIFEIRNNIDPDLRKTIGGEEEKEPTGFWDCSGLAKRATVKKALRAVGSKTDNTTKIGKKHFPGVSYNPFATRVEAALNHGIVIDILETIAKYGYDPDISTAKANLLNSVYLQ